VAVIFLRSTDGNNGNAGTQKEAAKATLAAAFTAAGAGGVVYVSSIHAETQASGMTLTSPGTSASPVRVLCVADWGAATGTTAPTTLATTATVSATGASSIGCRGTAYLYGITFTAGSGASDANINLSSGGNIEWVFDTCTLIIGGTGAFSRINMNQGGYSAVGIDLISTWMSFNSTSQGISSSGSFRLSWRGGGVNNVVIPTTLFSVQLGIATLRGVDLSVFGSGKSLINVGNGTLCEWSLADCKLGTSVSVTTGSVSGTNEQVTRMINCDSADTNYRYHHQVYSGTITHETTIKRTGGASDGTTGFSRKFVSTANAKFQVPLTGPWFKFWNSTLSSITVAIETVTDNVTLTDAEAWVEVLHQGTSGYPLGVFENDRSADVLATGANQTSSSETWTTTGLTTPVKQTLSKAVTPAEIGWIYARLVLAKASTTVYACPKILSTSTYQHMEEDGSIINGPTVSAGGGLIGGGNLSGGFL